MDITNQKIKEISSIVKDIAKLADDEERIFKEINNLNNGQNQKHLEELKKEFLTMHKEYPVSYLRRLVLEKVMRNEEITREFIEEKKKELQKSPRTFSNWGIDRLLIPLLITQDTVLIYKRVFESIVEYLEEKVDSFDELKYKSYIFNKGRAFFHIGVWISFFNRNYSSPIKCKQLFFEVIQNGNIKYGLSERNSNYKIITEIGPDDFDINQMIKNFRENINKVLEDTPENSSETNSNHVDKTDNIEEKTNMHENMKYNKNKKYPLNQILYGPPGTGKTYSTVLLASNIIGSLEGKEFSELGYNEALKLYRESLGDQIEFITFHQNYSYEDFVQGLRPDLDNSGSGLQFSKSEGIFKILADRAKQNLLDSQNDISKLSKEEIFYKGIEAFSQEISDTEQEELIKINDSAYINAIDKDAFRFKWYNSEHHHNGLRMKFKDLLVYYLEDIKTRKDAFLHKDELSALSISHSTYYLIVSNQIKKIAKRINTKELKPAMTKKKNYVLIIDEINRANISRVFGELITLLEPDKRLGNKYSMEVKLPLGDKFSVPNNLYIIGTMNTADKSIALLDIALRRRFEFVSMYPNYAIDSVKEVEFLKELNQRIIDTRGYDYQIGHSYFMGDDFNFLQVMNSKVIPLMQEYFMNNYKEVTKIISETISLVYDDKYKIAENIFPLQIIENENSQSL